MSSIFNLIALQSTQETYTPPPAQKGTQIVRPDGRIVVIPPIERPTTRSRNKKEPEKAKAVTKYAFRLQFCIT